MKLLARSCFVLAILVIPSRARAAPAANEVSVVVGSGPHAGKYGAKAEVQCFHSKSQEILAATYKDWNAHSARPFVTSGIRVYKRDGAAGRGGESAGGC